MYGAAFGVFVRGVLGAAPGTFANYVTAYAWPYVIGYLAILAPGGLGVRELALAQTLTALDLATPQQAFYVKCDAETNPPELRDVGQVVTEIGVAIVRPAEFVIFRISQFTAPSN